MSSYKFNKKIKTYCKSINRDLDDNPFISGWKDHFDGYPEMSLKDFVKIIIEMEAKGCLKYGIKRGDILKSISISMFEDVGN